MRLFRLAAVRGGLLLMTLAVPAWFGTALAATTYYIDQDHPSASDSNPGSAERPWKTMYRLNSQPLEPGDTVLVRPGRYRIADGGDWRRAAIRPAASGTAQAPITIRSSPRHGAHLVGNGSESALIGSYTRDHIVIDGFVISNPGPKGIAVFGTVNRRVQGVVVKNNIIHGAYVAGGDNAEGVRLEHASNSIVRDNKIFDIGNGQSTSNASAVKLYWSDHILIENNEMYDVVAGIKDKSNGEYIDVRRNLVHNCGIGIEVMNRIEGTTQSYRIYENIFACGTGVEGRTGGSALTRDVFIYNNVFAGYRAKAVMGTEHGRNRRIWNNIFYRTGEVSQQGDFFTHADPPSEIELMDYNLYAREPKFIVGLYSSNRTFNSLNAWQRQGFDRNSSVSTPRFVDPDQGNFRLAPDSPARNAGRVDGRADGAVVDIGAYPRNEGQVIGVTWERSSPAPDAPTGLTAD